MRLAVGIAILWIVSASCASDFECYSDPACGDGQICNGGKCVDGRRISGDGLGGDAGAVDVYGPLVNITSPQPFQLVAGVIIIKAEVLDQVVVGTSGRKEVMAQGVDSSAVTAVIMDSFVVEMNRYGDGGSFQAEFDTSLLGLAGFPSLVVTAYDVLGNKGEAGIEFALDSRGPVAALESGPVQFYRVSPDGPYEGAFECSRVFNPLESAVQHGDVIDSSSRFGLAFVVRARIQDQGNGQFPNVPVPIFGVKEETVRLYMLDKTGLDTPDPVTGTRKLLIDDGAGGCRINPDAIPNPTDPQPNEAIVQNLVPGGPVGEPNFAKYPSGGPVQIPVNSPCDVGGYTPPAEEGDEVEPAELICADVEETATLWMHYGSGLPAVWMLNDYDNEDSALCGGGVFDANNFSSDGPVCMVVAAEDKQGNTGVSQPIAICVERGGGPDCTNFDRTQVNAANMCTDGCATGPNAPLNFGTPIDVDPDVRPWAPPNEEEDANLDPPEPANP